MDRNPDMPEEIGRALFFQSTHDEAVGLWNEALDIIEGLLDNSVDTETPERHKAKEFILTYRPQRVE